MRAELIRIGNSRGVRIPKPLIEEVGFGDSVDLRVEDGKIILAKQQVPREGWAEAFHAAGATASSELLLEGANQFDEEDWRW